jgi:hypothetical protein
MAEKLKKQLSRKIRATANRLRAMLLRRTIGHAKAGSEVLRKQLNGLAVLFWPFLGQVAHSFDNEPLTFNVAGIGAARLARSRDVGTDRNREHFSQRPKTSRWNSERLTTRSACRQYSGALILIPFAIETLLVEKPSSQFTVRRIR